MMRVLFSILLLAAGAAAEPWPAWRGPSGNGVSPETGLPSEWSTSQNVAWKTPLRGMGVSSPIVHGDRVFVTYQIGRGPLRPGNHPTLVQGTDAAEAGEVPLGGVRPDRPDDKISLVVAAFSRADGALLWEYSFAAEGDLPETHQKSNLAMSSPVTDGERVYAWFATGQAAAVDMDGKLVWSRHLAKEFGPINIGWGHAASPALYGDRLFLLCYNSATPSLVAVDKRTGKDLWRTVRDEPVFSYSTPVMVDGPEGPELVVNMSTGVEALDPATGKQLWFYAEASRFPIPVPSPENGVVYMSRGYRSGPFMALKTGARGTVGESQVMWKVPSGAPYTSSVIQYNGLVYMANGMGIFTCIDAKTGERVWQERLGGIHTASPVAGDGKIYFLSETGETTVLRAGRTPTVLARNDLDEQLIASPAISEGSLFVRSTRHLFAIRTQR